MHLYEKPEPLRKFNPRVSPKLQTVVMRCLEKDRDKRYTNVPELIEALNKARYRGKWFPSGPPIPSMLSRVRRPIISTGRLLRRLALSPALYLGLGGLIL